MIWKGYDKRTNPKMRREMARLRERGWTFQRIAERFGVALSTVQYHLNPEYKAKTKRRAAKLVRKHRRRNREYLRRYIKERYHGDEKFRRRYLQLITDYQKRIIERNRKIRIPLGSVLKCSYCGHRWKPYVPYIPSRCPACGNLLIKLPIQYSRVSHSSGKPNTRADVSHKFFETPHRNASHYTFETHEGMRRKFGEP